MLMKTPSSLYSLSVARLTGLAGVVTAVVFSAGLARGAIVMTIAPSGGDVVAAAAGTANITGAQVIHTTGLAGPGLWGEFGGFIRIGSVPDTGTTLIVGVSSPGIWVSPLLAQMALATSSSAGAGLVGARDSGREVYLPGGYVSGAALNASSTWSGTTIESLGLTPGTYTWSWGTGGNADTLTINVVPEPGTTLLWLGALAAAGLRRQRKGSDGRD